MSDPTTQIAVSIGVDLAASLITQTCATVAKRLKRGAQRGSRLDTGAAQVSALLTGRLTRDNISLIAFAEAANKRYSAVDLEKAFAYPALAAVTQQLFAAMLVKSDTKKIDKIRESFPLALTIALDCDKRTDDIEVIATKLIDVLEVHFRSIISGLQEVDTEEPLPGLVGRLVLIEATLDSVDASLSGLNSRLTVSRGDFEIWLTKYRKQCLKAHGSLTPPDFKERNAVPIDDIYVPGRIVSAGNEFFTAEETVFDLIPRIDREVLLGDPGGGKSTSTAAIAHRLAGQPDGLVPFVVVLRDYAPKINEMSVVEFIEQRLRVFYQAGPTMDAVESLLREGRALVLFDGLDELLDSTRRVEVAERVELFSSIYPASKIFVTSRKVGYKEARLDPTVFTTHELSSYDDEDVTSYVQKWFSLQSGDSAAVNEVVASFLSESSAIPDLRSNPLLLALLCIIYRGQGYLPQNRVGIYEECSKLLFQTWDKSRGLTFDFSFESHLADALKHLAYWMFTADTGSEGVEESKLVRELSQFFEGRTYESGDRAMIASEQFIGFCRGRGWVLSDAGTTGDGVALFKFTHRTFMEYFAANQLTRLNPVPQKLARELLPHVSKNEWDTVGQLAIHLINESADRGAEKALAQMLDSSKNRSVEYRENVLEFVARCLDYLPVSPGFLRRAVRDSFDVLTIAASKNNRDFFMATMSWKSFCYLELKGDGAVEEEIESLCGALLDKNTPVTRIAAFVVLTNIQYGPNHKAARLNPRAEAWTRRMQHFATTRYHVLLESGDYWVKDAAFMLYLRNIIGFAVFRMAHAEENDLPLDYLFREFDTIDNGRAATNLQIWPFIVSAELSTPRPVKAFPEATRLTRDLVEDVRKDLLGRELTPPILNAGISAARWGAFAHSELGAEESLIVDDQALKVILTCAAVDRFPALIGGSDGFASLLDELMNYRAGKGPLPKTYVDTASRSSEKFRTLLEGWAAGSFVFAAPFSTSKKTTNTPPSGLEIK